MSGKQQSVRYEAPAPFEEWPHFDDPQRLVAWLRERYVDYPAYLDLMLLGAVDFMGLDSVQGTLHAG